MNENEVVMITGCSTGLGRAMCRELKQRGYQVVATARKVEALEEVEADLKLYVDVTDRESIFRAVEEVRRVLGRIDILINNAGYSIRSSIEELQIEKLQKMFDVNVFGVIQMTQAVLPVMREQRRGKIINIGSISGVFAQAVNGGYCASKHAVEAINKALRLELKDFGIQSTVIEPGATQTNFFTTLAKNVDHDLSAKDSPYRRLNEADIQYRKTQKRADPEAVARQIGKVISQKKLKMQYVVGISPMAHHGLKHCPNALLEYCLLKHAK